MISADLSNDSSDTTSEMTLDMTPLIDIIFIILVFLILTANSQLLSLPIEVPTSPDQELTAVAQEKTITINVMPSAPFWAIDGQTFEDFSQLERLFIEAYHKTPKQKVIIAADSQAQVQALMSLLALMQRLQITQTQILMEN